MVIILNGNLWCVKYSLEMHRKKSKMYFSNSNLWSRLKSFVALKSRIRNLNQGQNESIAVTITNPKNPTQLKKSKLIG